MATTNRTKGQVTALAKQLIAGTAKHLASTTHVALLGGSFTPDQITWQTRGPSPSPVPL
jgi:hypothetical protein